MGGVELTSSLNTLIEVEHIGTTSIDVVDFSKTSFSSLQAFTKVASFFIASAMDDVRQLSDDAVFPDKPTEFRLIPSVDSLLPFADVSTGASIFDTSVGIGGKSVVDCVCWDVISVEVGSSTL